MFDDGGFNFEALVAHIAKFFKDLLGLLKQIMDFAGAEEEAETETE